MKKCMLIFGVILCTLFTYNLTICYAENTWFVRPNGSSSNLTWPWNGTSKDQAFHGLSNVIWGDEGVKAGDTLILCREADDPQVFTRTLVIRASGTQERPIIIQSENPYEPEKIVSQSQINWPGLEGYDSSKPTTSGNFAIHGNGVNYITIRNIDIVNCGGTKFINCSFLILDNLKMRNVYSGVMLEGGGYNIVENCNINHSVNVGIGLLGTDPETTTPIHNTIIRNNVVSYSLLEDGITLHQSNDGYYYNIGGNNQVIGNTSYRNHEEGLDITSGNPVLVEGNTTYENKGSGTIIWHGARNVTFRRNKSYNEQGLVMGQEDGDVNVAYNIFDSGPYSSLIVSRGKNYKIYNNIFKSSGATFRPATIDIRVSAEGIDFQNNIIIATESNGFVLRIAHGTPTSRNITFNRNAFWQDSGVQAVAFYDVENESYKFDMFKNYSSVTENLFLDPQIDADYSLSQYSQLVNTEGAFVSGSYLEIDFVGNTVDPNQRNIGAIQYTGVTDIQLLAPLNLRVNTDI